MIFKAENPRNETPASCARKHFPWTVEVQSTDRGPNGSFNSRQPELEITRTSLSPWSAPSTMHMNLYVELRSSAEAVALNAIPMPLLTRPCSPQNLHMITSLKHHNVQELTASRVAVRSSKTDTVLQSW